MGRVFNFSSGPAMLPEPVLQEAQQEILDWHGRGCSIMETSHRSDEFVAIMAETEQLLRSLMGVPSNYRVLFLQGGAHLQFSMVPLNLLGAKFHADYLLSGIWSDRAAERVLVQLKGHRLVGGLRDSIYNAMPLAGVRALVDYMRDFEHRHG